MGARRGPDPGEEGTRGHGSLIISRIDCTRPPVRARQVEGNEMVDDRKTILIVEDNELNLKLFHDVL